MVDSNPTTSPYLTGIINHSTSFTTVTKDEQLQMNKFPVRALLGCLRYAAEWAHPEILEPLGVLCRSMENPNLLLWKATKEILRYLYSCRHEGLTFMSTGNKTYVDSNWAGCSSTRRSTTVDYF